MLTIVSPQFQAVKAGLQAALKAMEEGRPYEAPLPHPCMLVDRQALTRDEAQTRAARARHLKSKTGGGV